LNQQCNMHTEGHVTGTDLTNFGATASVISSDVSRFQGGRTIKPYDNDYISCNSSAFPNRQCWDIPDYNKGETASSTWMPVEILENPTTIKPSGALRQNKVRTGFELIIDTTSLSRASSGMHVPQYL
jgi:hypothetical protein